MTSSNIWPLHVHATVRAVTELERVKKPASSESDQFTANQISVHASSCRHHWHIIRGNFKSHPDFMSPTLLNHFRDRSIVSPNTSLRNCGGISLYLEFFRHQPRISAHLHYLETGRRYWLISLCYVNRYLNRNALDHAIPHVKWQLHRSPCNLTNPIQYLLNEVLGNRIYKFTDATRSLFPGTKKFLRQMRCRYMKFLTMLRVRNTLKKPFRGDESKKDIW